MATANEVITIYGRIKHESPKALLILVNTEKHPDVDYISELEQTNGMWFPLSQIKEIHKGSVLGDGVGNDHIVVSLWIARQKGISS